MVLGENLPRMNHWLFSLSDGCEEYKNVVAESFLRPFKNWLCSTFDKHVDCIGDSKDQFRKTLSTSFNANAWHLFLLAYFDARGFSILQARPHGPDIVLRHQDKEIFVEAVEATPGEVPENRPIDPLDYDGAVNIPFPDPKIQLRLANTITFKKNKIDSYLKNAIIPADAPIFIAVNSFINYRNLSVGSTNSCMFRTLYSLGADKIYFDRKTLKSTGTETQIKKTIEKFSRPLNKNIEFEAPFFQFDEYSNISGVINTDCNTYNLFSKNGKELELILNVNAKNPVSDEFGPFPYTLSPVAHERGLRIDLKNSNVSLY